MLHYSGIIEGYAALLEAMRVQLALGDQHRLVGIDGLPGTGKTTLARSLSADLNLDHVEMDLELHGPDGHSYIDQLRARRAAITSALGVRTAGGNVLIDSVLLNDVLDLLGCYAHVTIYVLPAPDSIQEDFLNDEISESELLEQIQRDARALRIPPRQLDMDLAIYHKRRSPAERASLLYRRHDDDDGLG